MESSPTRPSTVPGSLPSDRRSIFTAPCPGCGRAMLPSHATDYMCPSCGRSYHASLGYLMPVEQEGS
jgi:hypothetical protein